MTIDRIDETKDYCPENCRWITREDNARYKSTTKMMTVDGVSHTGKDWAKICVVGINIINTIRRKHGEEIAKEFVRRRLANMEIKANPSDWLKAYDLT
mgnify:CR=1 FL=1